MVKDLENQLELKISEINRLNKQINSLQQTNTNSDALKDKYKNPDSKVCICIAS